MIFLHKIKTKNSKRAAKFVLILYCRKWVTVLRQLSEGTGKCHETMQNIAAEYYTQCIPGMKYHHRTR